MTPNTLSLTEESSVYLLRLPYAFKDAFRELFKTAAWQPARKAFVVKATAANRNKWETFVGKAKELELALDARDAAQATEAEIQRTCKRLDDARETLERECRAAQVRTAELNTSLADCNSAIERLRPIRDSAVSNEAEARKQAQAASTAMRDAIRPAVDVLERHGVDGVLVKMLAAASTGYAGKSWLREHQESLQTARDELAEVGYRHPLLDRVCNYSLNRADKFAHAAPLLRANLLTKLEPYVET